MALFSSAFVTHQPIHPRYSRMIVSILRRRVLGSPELISQDGEHVAKLAPKTFLMYLDPTFQSTPIMRAHHAQNLTERRLLVGFTDAGLTVESRRVLTPIPPHSMCTISFPRSHRRQFRLHGMQVPTVPAGSTTEAPTVPAAGVRGLPAGVRGFPAGVRGFPAGSVFLALLVGNPLSPEDLYTYDRGDFRPW